MRQRAGGCGFSRAGGRWMDAFVTVRMVPSMAEPAAAADVDEHRFGTGPAFTVGVEEEYMLLDPETFDLVPRAESILQAEAGGEFAENVAPELYESLVEF